MGSSAPPGPPPNLSQALASLQIGEILAGRGRLAFQARGICMFPCVRPGDVLHIEPRTVEQVAIGDIAVYRREGHLFGHRTVGKGEGISGAYILTQPDRTTQVGDRPRYNEDLLGTVKAIERNGRLVEPHRRSYAQPTRSCLAAWLALLEWCHHQRAWLLRSMGYIQRSRIYRCAAGLSLAAMRNRVSYVVHVPFQAGGAHGLCHAVPPDEFDVAKASFEGQRVECWTLALHVGRMGQPAAQATFVFRRPECPLTGWWVGDLRVRARYRGADLEHDLFFKAEQILARGGAREVKVSIPMQTPVIADLFKGLGFQETGTHTADEVTVGSAEQSTCLVLRKSIVKRCSL